MEARDSPQGGEGKMVDGGLVVFTKRNLLLASDTDGLHGDVLQLSGRWRIVIDNRGNARVQENVLWSKRMLA